MKIKQLTLLLGGFASCANALADSDIESITVTANRIAENVSESLSNVEVISRVDIEAAHASNILDLLRSTAGIDFSQQGGFGQSSSVYIRGTNANHTLVLVDGIRVGSATLGTTELQSIAPSLIERIEIIKGPRAAIWGSDAIAGVIHIITRKQTAGEVSLSASLGSEKFQQLQASVGFEHGDGQSSISVISQEDEGFDVLSSAEPDKDGYEYFALTYNGEQKLTKQFTLDWMATVNQNDTEYDNAYGGNNLSKRDNYAWLLRGAYRSELAGAKSITSISLSQAQDKNKDTKASDPNASTTLFETDRTQITALNHNQWQNGIELTLGADLQQEAITSSTNYVDDERFVFGTFARAGYQLGNFNSEVALRYDEVGDTDSETTYSLGLGYKFDGGTKLVVTKGTGFKAPTFNDLYYPEDAYSAGNEELVSEKSDMAEAIISHSYRGFAASLSVYRGDIKNLIAWQADENFFYQPQNVSSVSLEGAEITLSLQDKLFRHEASLSYNEALDDDTGLQLIRRSKQAFNYALTADLGHSEVYLQYNYRGAAYDSGYDENFAPVRIKLASYSLINAAISYELNKHIKLTARIDNLLDKNYTTSNNYNTQGRSWHVGASASF